MSKLEILDAKIKVISEILDAILEHLNLEICEPDTKLTVKEKAQ